jgi:hypothetical protein
MKARQFNIVHIPDKWHDQSEPDPSLGSLVFDLLESSLCLSRSRKQSSVLLRPEEDKRLKISTLVLDDILVYICRL